MTAQLQEYDAPQDRGPEPLELAPDLVEVRRNAGLLGVVGAVAAAVAIAWAARAAGTQAPLDWAMAGLVGVIAIGNLWALVDARTPLLVADAQGVRLRRGRAWQGLPWSSLAGVEVARRRSKLADGQLRVIPHNPERVLEELGAPGVLRRRFAGDPFAVPVGLATRVVGAPQGLPEALALLSGGATEIVDLLPATKEPAAEPEEAPEILDRAGEEPRVDQIEVDADELAAVEVESESEAEVADGFDEEVPESRRSWFGLRDPRPKLAAGIGLLATRRREDEDETDDTQDAEGSLDEGDHDIDEARTLVETEPAAGIEDEEGAEVVEERVVRILDDAVEESVSESRAVARADLTLAPVPLVDDVTDEAADDEAAVDEEAVASRRTRRWGRVTPIARPGNPVAPLEITDPPAEPAADPVIGPELLAARTRLGLTVDQLADRTRIRPHVIESIEVDDFTPCGGDFYARGHLRTLCRVLGVDVAPMLTSYDERYAHAPISPRRVFEAELASGSGMIRGPRGGLNWSLLVAVVMALILVWSVARLVMDAPAEVRQVAGLSAGSGGLQSGAAGADQVPVLIHAAGGGATVVVRDGEGEIVFTGDLAYGTTRTLKVAPPVRIESSDGGVEVVIDGAEKGRLGDPGEPASGTFIAR